MNNTLLDLHTHTTASDGIFTPAKLIDYSIEKGLSVIAITDHDTVGGVDEGLRHADQTGFTCIPGIEFSVDYPDGSFHLVGLYIDHTNEMLVDILQELKKYRDNRIYHMIDDLKKHDINITVEEVQKEADGGSIGRPHVARVLVARGYGENIRDIFQNFLIEGKPGFVKKKKITLDNAVTVIEGAGGIPVLAHPASLAEKVKKPFENILTDLMEQGVIGIEAYASMHTPQQVEEYISLAEKYKLLVTGGSDFHGDKDEKIGYYSEELPIPYSVYENITAMHEKMK
jgi:predicted metal-dependent phosphoesterase TrpH